MTLLSDVNEDTDLRRLFGRFPTGVTALCALERDEPLGMTASAFVAVSLDPPLVSVCIKRGSGTWRQLRTQERVGISFLGNGHAATARQLAQKTGDRFLGLAYEATPDGAVFLTDATAWLECSVEQEIAAGDHDIVLFRLHRATVADGILPLVFHSSDFHTLAPMDHPQAVSGLMVRLIDIVFPGDANHHGTLFGGVGLAHLDKVAFLAASRHARRSVVTAGCERIDFAAPARIGEMVEAVGRVVRVGRSSLAVEVELHAEALLSGERRLCTRGLFNMVALKGDGDDAPLAAPIDEGAADDGWLRTTEMVFPGTTNHYGTLFGGDALKLLGKAAFVTATRHARQVMVMAATNRIDFRAPIDGGDMVELVSRVKMVGRSSLSVEVQLWAERLLTGERRRSATAEFVMVAVDDAGRPKTFAGESDSAIDDRTATDR